MKRVVTILGTRPEIIRLSRIMPLLDKYCNHTIVNTMQNYDYKLNDIFFQELCLRKPDVQFDIKKGSFVERVASMMLQIEQVFKRETPDAVLILGDTNSGLCGIVAERMGIPVYHMEAGNRCFDRAVPEEVNRRIIDSISSYNLPYNPGSRENLIKEGVDKTHIFTCGNPIGQVLDYYRYRQKIKDSEVIAELGLRPTNYFLATFHREETVDDPDRLFHLVIGLQEVGIKYGMPVICSVHPRTQIQLGKMKLDKSKYLHFLEPFGFFDFVKLEQDAKCILTDSGTVSEEACLMNVPCVIMRDVTERPELLECGSAMLSGVNTRKITLAAEIMCDRHTWSLPVGYADEDVAHKVVQYILGERI